MCLIVQNSGDMPISLPVNYNHLVQAAIYSNISRELADFLHDKGFLLGKRSFKLFIFSRLLGRHFIDGGTITYSDKITLYVSSPLEKFIQELANTMLKRGFIVLGNNRLRITELSFPPKPKIGNEVKIDTLSPITVYSTLLTPEGKKKTYYYSPYEKEFSKLIDANAKKKYFILNKRKIKSKLAANPLKVKEVLVMYKDTVVKGWSGSFYLKGPKSLIETVYETGLGSKNSQGFGMFEVSR